MNPFVNPRKRGAELPRGYKDLAEVLNDHKLTKGKCKYCGSFYAKPDDRHDYPWCKKCDYDLEELSHSQAVQDVLDSSPPDKVAEELDRLLTNFMRERVKARKTE